MTDLVQGGSDGLPRRELHERPVRTAVTGRAEDRNTAHACGARTGTDGQQPARWLRERRLWTAAHLWEERWQLQAGARLQAVGCRL